MTDFTFANSAQRLSADPAEEQSEGWPPTEDDGADSASDSRATTSENNVRPQSTSSEGLTRPSESLLVRVRGSVVGLAAECVCVGGGGGWHDGEERGRKDTSI